MRKKIQLGMISLALIFLTGCVETNVIEELAIITARGIDVAEDDKIEKTVNFMRFDPQSDSIYGTVSGVGKTLKGAREVIARQVSYKLREGQLNAEIYGKGIAERGISSYIMSSVRDARTSDTMYLVVAEETAKEIFNAKSEEASRVGKFLDELLEKETEVGNIPSSSLQDFSRRAATTGQDGVIPIVGLKDGVPTLKGLGLFHNDQLALEISLKESLLLKLIIDDIKDTPFEMAIPSKPVEKYHDESPLILHEQNQEKQEVPLNFLIVEGKSKTNMKNFKNLTYETDISMKIDLLEIYDDIKINKRGVTKVLEKELEKEFKKQFEGLLNKTQEANVDPFGYGKIYRIAKKQGLITEEEWDEKYPKISVDFNVNVDIMHTGTTE
ncbi:Ger(x)C family spore germination protein [Oceanobacillus sp. Castelsardo]|uniref:Ger(x)C family spore germination protein n=1 Tax=Oceanobacillus sp. Castelsardo TaxID=1851204 RepID=UPI0008384653|nr:Ger(x)C family spore germination protein [Oceanobacillus sp. Castelsardo]